MSRPRKDSAQADARGRIIEAFWSQLETKHVDQLNVRQITSVAGCNRGTFYYHFRDMDDLFQQALNNELFHDSMFPHTMYEIVCGEGNVESFEQLSSTYSKRMTLLLEKGGVERTVALLKSSIIGAWTQILHPEGGSLTPASKVLLGFNVSGIVSILIDACQHERQSGESLNEIIDLTPFVKGQAIAVIQQVSQLEGISPEQMKQAVAQFDFTDYVLSTTRHDDLEKAVVA